MTTTTTTTITSTSISTGTPCPDPPEASGDRWPFKAGSGTRCTFLTSHPRLARCGCPKPGLSLPVSLTSRRHVMTPPQRTAASALFRVLLCAADSLTRSATTASHAPCYPPGRPPRARCSACLPRGWREGRLPRPHDKDRNLAQNRPLWQQGFVQLQLGIAEKTRQSCTPPPPSHPPR